jgi:prepilin-type N-terminal cleavage/methylation domain-containing protein
MCLKSRFRKLVCGGEKGFTLIELLIVVAVLGALASVVVPNVSSFLGVANIAAANTEVMNVKTASLSFLASEADFPADSDLLYPGIGTDYLSALPKAKYYFDTIPSTAHPTYTGTGKIIAVDYKSGGWVDPMVFDLADQAWRKIRAGDAKTGAAVP